MEDLIWRRAVKGQEHIKSLLTSKTWGVFLERHPQLFFAGPNLENPRCGRRVLVTRDFARDFPSFFGCFEPPGTPTVKVIFE